MVSLFEKKSFPVESLNFCIATGVGRYYLHVSKFEH